MMGQDGNLDHRHRTTEEGPRIKLKTIGIDLAKDVFGVHGVNARGKAQVHRRVTRKHLLGLLAKLEPCLLGMEACGSAHHWAREIEQLGHNSEADEPTVREAPPQGQQE